MARTGDGMDTAGLSFIDGNEAIAHGAIRAGCTFFAGYPITPATTIFQHMLELLPPLGGICLQGEDEIASIGFCLGASMAGLKVMTATSGPGISLFSEHLSFAIGSEIPLVLVDVQRLGPSTGSATKGADGDIQFLRWGCSSGLPLIVLAPADVADCFILTIHAFNLAETYRCPVILASNKEIGMTRECVALEELETPAIQNRIRCPEEREFLPHQAIPGTDIPWFLPIGGRRPVRITSSTHGPDGYITTDPGVIGRTIQRLEKKPETARTQPTCFEADAGEGGAVLLITYGVTSRAAREAVHLLRSDNEPISLLILKQLYPVPEELLKQKLAEASRAVVVEMNRGLYVREIERLAGTTPVSFYGRMDGELIGPGEIIRAVHP